MRQRPISLGRRDAGYSPLEVLTTLLLIGILIGFLLVRFLGWRDAAMDRDAQATVREGALVAEAVYADNLTFVQATIENDVDLVAEPIGFVGDDADAAGSHQEMVLYRQSGSGTYFGAIWITAEPLRFCSWGETEPVDLTPPANCEFAAGGFSSASSDSGGLALPTWPGDPVVEAAGIHGEDILAVLGPGASNGAAWSTMWNDPDITAFRSAGGGGSLTWAPNNGSFYFNLTASTFDGYTIMVSHNGPTMYCFDDDGDGASYNDFASECYPDAASLP